MWIEAWQKHLCTDGDEHVLESYNVLFLTKLLPRLGDTPLACSCSLNVPLGPPIFKMAVPRRTKQRTLENVLWEDGDQDFFKSL